MTQPNDTPPAEGHLTFVFTDVEGSTSLTDYYEKTEGEAAYNALRNRMRDALLETVHENDGFEVQRAGDGHFCVFENPIDAVRAVIQFQKRLTVAQKDEEERRQLKVRIGAHYCHAVRKAETYTLAGGATLFEYSGSDTNFAARVGAQGAGEQVLFSEKPGTRRVGRDRA